MCILVHLSSHTHYWKRSKRKQLIYFPALFKDAEMGKMQVNGALRRELWAAGIRSMHQIQCVHLSMVCPHGRFYCRCSLWKYEYPTKISRGLAPCPECVLEKWGSDLHIRLLTASYTSLLYPRREQQRGVFWCWMPEFLEPGQSLQTRYGQSSQ